MNHGNFNIQAFQENQRNLQNAFNNVVMPQQVQTEMPDFCAERIIDNQDDDQMVLLCNFTCREFLTIYEKVRPALEDAHTGGRNGYYTPATIFLITLIYLKNDFQLNAITIWLHIHIYGDAHRSNSNYMFTNPCRLGN